MRKIIFYIAIITFLASCKGGQKTTTLSPEAKAQMEKEQLAKEKQLKQEKKARKAAKAAKKAEEERKALEEQAKLVEGKLELIIKEGRTYIGTPYKYGGSTRSGIDCSAFTGASYKAAEVVLPRTAGDQSNFGKAVSLMELKKGDLVFFTDKKGNTKVTHVGMVTEVKGTSVRFIHASSHAGVVEVELFTDYYKPLILKAVRVL